uniref:Retrotransposon gag domain-containing protein n=1 Tax=Tanacetum cinerariifolium TaxID=118510 RepID=A0A6L2NUE1_TANCI|nr:hypothetical protein [Tanacetum cinerariifolium]
MRTRRSVRTSSLAYDPEVERSARLRRKAVRQFSTNLDFAGLKELFTKMSDDDATGAESPPRGSIHSWSEMKSTFLDEFYSISKTAAIRNKIKSFRQIPIEQFHEAFSRLKELLRTCPYHDVPKWELFKVFYDGLDYHNQQFVMATSGGKGVSNVSQVSHNACSMCGDLSHSVNNCQSWGAPSNEEVNGVYGNRPRKDPFSESYNSGCRNHPNFHWKDDANYNLPNNTQQQNHGYKPSAHDFSHDVEDFVTDDEIIVEGKKADNVKSDSELVNDLLKDFPKPTTQNPEATESPKVGEGGVSSTTTPYLVALEKSSSTRLAKKGPHYEDMWETFKQVKINLPFIDAIKQIHAYAKFLKDLCTQKRKLKATLPKKIDLTEHVSVVLSSSLPPKFKDPRASLISVVVGNITIKKVLLDLGASINIFPASLVDKYDLGTLRKSDTIISLADRSTNIPRGILEYFIMKVDDFYYPVDFFVMDTESPYKDVQQNIILGRPFLATIDTRINCQSGAMDITFGNKKIRLNVFNSLNSPISNDCYHIDTINECIQTHTPSKNLDRTLENLHYVDSEKELFDGMMFHEKEEEFQMIEEEFLLSLEEMPLQSQQVQQPTLNEVQEYVKDN